MLMYQAVDMCGKAVTGERIERRLTGIWLVTRWESGYREIKIRPETVKEIAEMPARAHTAGAERRKALRSTE